MSDVRLQVEVAAWELECCGGPLRLGDEVSWRLLFTEDGAAPERVWTSTPVPDVGPGWSARVLDNGTLQAAWTEPVPDLPTGVVRLRGRLAATWHGGQWHDDLPALTGRVECMQVVRGRSAQTGEPTPGGRAWVVVPGTSGGEDVDLLPVSGDPSPAEAPHQPSPGTWSTCS